MVKILFRTYCQTNVQCCLFQRHLYSEGTLDGYCRPCRPVAFSHPPFCTVCSNTHLKMQFEIDFDVLISHGGILFCTALLLILIDYLNIYLITAFP